MSFDLGIYIGNILEFLRFDRLQATFIAILSGNDIANFNCFSSNVFTLSCPQLFWGFRELTMLVIASLSVERLAEYFTVVIL